MSNYFRTIGFLLAGAAIFTSPLCAAQYKIQWLLGHVNLDYFEEAAQNFKKTVETESNGNIEVEIVTAENEAVSDIALHAKMTPEIANKVARGEAEMGHSFTNVIGALDSRFWAFEAPYLFRGYPHLEGMFEGPTGEALLEGLRAHNTVGLAFTYSGGANGVATLDREVRRPEDLKGLKVGFYGDKVNEAWLKSLGAIPVTIRHGTDKILQLSREGSLDAVMITWRNFERAELHKKFKYFNLAGSNHLVSVTYINEKFYESLPQNYRDLLKRAARESAGIERAKTIELNEDAKRDMLSKGVRAVYLSEGAKRNFVKVLKPVYKSAITNLIGKDFLKKIKKTDDNLVYPLVPSVLTKR